MKRNFLLTILGLILIISPSVFAKNANIAHANAESILREWGITDIENTNNENISKIFLNHEVLEEGLLKIFVQIESITNSLIGASFNLYFDNEKLSFLNYLPGSFFEQGGDPIYLITQKESKIIFGETLLKDDEFPLGEGTLVELVFQILDAPPYEFSFEKGVLASSETVLQDLIEVKWENLEIQEIENFENIIITNSKSKNYNKIFSLQNIALALLLSISVIVFSLFLIQKNKTFNLNRV